MTSQSIPVCIPGSEREILVEIARTQGEQEIGVQQYSLATAFDQIRDLSKSMASLLAEISPKKASIEFGMQLGVESGALTALIAKGTASANFKVTLHWE